MKKLILIAFALFLTSCGSNDSNTDTGSIDSGHCITCLATYSGNPSMAVTLWQTTDGTKIDNCDSNTPLPPTFTCDPNIFDCGHPHLVISTSDIFCQ